MPTDDQLDAFIARARSGDEQALAHLFELHRPRLRRMVLLRLDPRVQARIDASDVVQEAFVDAAKKMSKYSEAAEIPFFLWLRMIAGERLIQLHRMHLGAAMRGVHREISLEGGSVPEASSMCLASQLAGNFTSADRNLLHGEIQQKLQNVLNRMAPTDREIVAMRHFEELSTDEMAVVLGLTRSGVLKRYTRAIRRLRDHIQGDSDLNVD